MALATLRAADAPATLAPCGAWSKRMYDDRYVAFVDILGFTEIVRKTEHDTTDRRYDALVKTLTEIGSFDEETINESDDFKFQSFSDSVIMSTATTQNGLLHLLHLISNLSIHLLSNGGLLMRGAIAKGKLHHDQSVMFGPAFLAAYYTESHIAKYPRVVLNREVYQDFQTLAPRLHPQVLLADDGPPYLHVFARFRLLNEGQPTPDHLNSPEAILAQTCQSSIQNLLNESIYEPRHYEKLRWLAIYWNSTVLTGTAGAGLGMIVLPVSRNMARQ